MSAELKPYAARETKKQTPIQVSVLYANGKEDTIGCHDKVQTQVGWEFVEECDDGRISVHYVYVSEVARLSIKESAMSYFRSKQTPVVALQQVQPFSPPHPTQPSSAPPQPAYVPSPLESLNRPLRSVTLADGSPVSELPDGRVVGAGFFLPSASAGL